MKKLLLILLCLPMLLLGQNLEYNRTIDTLFSLTIPSGTAFDGSNQLIIGDYLSIPNGKVWKVQSIMLMSPLADTGPIAFCSSGNYGNLSSITASIVMMIKNNGIEQRMYSRIIPSNINDQGENYLKSPLWCKNSELGFGFTHTYTDSINNIICLSSDFTAHIHFSILEFNGN